MTSWLSWGAWPYWSDAQNWGVNEIWNGGIKHRHYPRSLMVAKVQEVLYLMEVGWLRETCVSAEDLDVIVGWGRMLERNKWVWWQTEYILEDLGNEWTCKVKRIEMSSFEKGGIKEEMDDICWNFEVQRRKID